MFKQQQQLVVILMQLTNNVNNLKHLCKFEVLQKKIEKILLFFFNNIILLLYYNFILYIYKHLFTINQTNFTNKIIYFLITLVNI